jgi:hypothetical protein
MQPPTAFPRFGYAYVLALCLLLLTGGCATVQTDPLPAWNARQERSEDALQVRISRPAPAVKKPQAYPGSGRAARDECDDNQCGWDHNA